MKRLAKPDYIIIADPDSLRWHFYQQALGQYLDRCHPRPSVRLLDWATVIQRDGDLTDLLPQSDAILRVESPGRNFSLFRGLMQAGEREEGLPSSTWVESRPGWIASPRLLYRGLCRILSNVEWSVSARPEIALSSSLTDTQTLFDKNAVSSMLTENGLATPPAFHPVSLDDLFEELTGRDWTRAYVKLAFGSCASGIALVQLRPRLSAITTVVEIGGRFFNTYDVRRVDSNELVPILRFLVDETSTVQQPINKLRVDGDSIDVRLVVIAGEVVASIFRASQLPMTNLHLGGYRADPDQCRRLIGARGWSDAVDLARRAAKLYQMAALGIDMALDRKTMKPQIIEINAFGDFFPNWTDASGRTLHQIEIEATAARLSDAA